MDEKIDKLDSNFNKSSWFNAINIGWGMNRNFLVLFVVNFTKMQFFY